MRMWTSWCPKDKSAWFYQTGAEKVGCWSRSRAGLVGHIELDGEHLVGVGQFGQAIEGRHVACGGNQALAGVQHGLRETAAQTCGGPSDCGQREFVSLVGGGVKSVMNDMGGVLSQTRG
jgi:hypothetical protein